ncbi:uncharacterized protein LOC136086801 [Hydra vulgaris]|uniref:Uncharacterized protein LOC136086801 n=1 Tax=Hydra vulgaris TaxID=6087 RepID=A0ABM4CTU3_HYDVU
MSFLKIEDPEKRDKIVKEFLDTKKRIRQNNLYEKMGETNLQSDLEKFSHPVLMVKQANREIMKSDSKELLPSHKENKAIKLGKISTDYLRMYISSISYLRMYISSKKSIDTTFGIHSKDDVLYIGKKPIHINDNGIIIDGETYYGTPGLQELITKFNPNKAIYIENDLKNYQNILIQSTENPYKPKSSWSGKYREIIAPIWRDIKEKNGKRESKGTGMQTIILPSDPNALIEMLELRIAEWKAGNTGSRNEAVAIFDELLRQGVINSSQKWYIRKYKRFMLKQLAASILGKIAITAAKSAGKELFNISERSC